MAAVGAMLICGSDAMLAPGDAAMQYDSTGPAPSGAPLGAPLGGDAADALDPAERALAEHLARRYAIASSDIGRFVASAFRAAAEVGLDPLLVLAVISVESSFNPLAESVMGAKGLMQIIPKYHRGKLAQFGGEAAVLDAESNIHVGARILQEYVYRAGTLEGGLQFYNGAYTDGNAQYAQKVMAERRRLLSVLRSPGRI